MRAGFYPLAVFCLGLLIENRTFAQNTEVDQLKKILAIQQARLSSLEKKLCTLTAEPDGNCTKIACGDQQIRICNGKDGLNGLNGRDGSPGVNATNNLKGRIICSASDQYSMKNCCGRTYPGAMFAVWDGEQSPNGSGGVNYGVFCFAP